MVDRFLIYGLVDPTTGQLRYIGRSSSGLKRPREHLRAAPTSDRSLHKNRWIKQVFAAGLQPGIVVLQVLEELDVLNQAEVHWIAYFRAMGCPLTNLTNGGDGVTGWKMPESQRQAQSQRLMGHYVSPETKAKISRSHVGLKASPEARKNLKKARNLRGPATVETRTKMSAAQKGKSPSANVLAAFDRTRKKTRVADQYGNQYESMHDAARKLNLAASNINAVLKGRYRQTGGYTFSEVRDV